MTGHKAATLLVLTVLLAGCQLGGPGTDADVSTADGNGTATEGPFGDASLPPGVDESGVSDVDALMAAHSSTMNGTSATVDIGFHLTVNESGRNVSLLAKETPGGDRGWLRADLANGVGTYYTADGTTYYREVVDGRASYGTTDGVSAIPERPRFGADERIRTAIESAEWTPVGTVGRDGQTVLEFRAISVDPPNVNATENATVSSSGRLLVDSDGVVHHVEVETTVEQDGETVRYGITVSLSDVGSTTIERPDWVDNAEGS